MKVSLNKEFLVYFLENIKLTPFEHNKLSLKGRSWNAFMLLAEVEKVSVLYF